MTTHTVNFAEFTAVLNEFFTKHVIHLTYDAGHEWTAQDYKNKTIFLYCIDRVTQLDPDIIKHNRVLYTLSIFADRFKERDAQMARQEFMTLQHAFSAASVSQTIEL